MPRFSALLMAWSLLGAAYAGLECTLCKEALEKVDDSIVDVNATAIVESTCDKVPDILGARDKCLEEAAEIIDDLLNETVATALDPETACECLGACDPSEAKKPTAIGGSIECALCEAAVEATDAILELNATQNALEEAIDAACASLGSLLSGTCEKLFDGEITDMIQCEVDSALKPATFCASLGRC